MVIVHEVFGGITIIAGKLFGIAFLSFLPVLEAVAIYFWRWSGLWRACLESSGKIS